MSPLLQRTAERIEPPLRHATERFGLRAADVLPLIVIAISALVVYLGLQVGDEVYEAIQSTWAASHVDQPILDWMVRHRSAGINRTVTDFTHLGGPVWFPLIAVLIVCWLTWLRRTPSSAIILIGGLGCALAFTLAGKYVTARARPPHDQAVPPFESTPSFPSGHTITATVAAMLTAYLATIALRSGWARGIVITLCVLWAFGMGISRVYLGHHWLTDVVAGWALGAAWSAFVIVLDQARRLVRAHRHEDAATPGNVAG